jgi:hypothetical protein
MISSMSATQLEKLKEEVRENDVRREQSLKQLKDWLVKHPFISNYNMGKFNEKYIFHVCVVKIIFKHEKFISTT